MTQASDRIETEAARWLIQVESAGSPEKWAALDSWLASSLRHRAAFLRLSAAWRRVERLRTLRLGGRRLIESARGAQSGCAKLAVAARMVFGFERRGGHLGSH